MSLGNLGAGQTEGLPPSGLRNFLCLLNGWCKPWLCDCGSLSELNLHWEPLKRRCPVLKEESKSPEFQNIYGKFGFLLWPDSLNSSYPKDTPQSNRLASSVRVSNGNGKTFQRSIENTLIKQEADCGKYMQEKVQPQSLFVLCRLNAELQQSEEELCIRYWLKWGYYQHQYSHAKVHPGTMSG